MWRKIRRLYRSRTLGLALKGAVGDRIALLGEKLGWESLVYNRLVFAGFHRTSLETSVTMVTGILQLFPAVRSAVDFGCGTGSYVSELRKRGLSAEGFEHSEIARKFARQSLGLEIQPFDLSKFSWAGRTFDLCISIEVAEHLPPHLGDRLVEVCCRHADCVVFTAAHPGQRGQGHINLQPTSYWIERFVQRGFRFEDTKTQWLQHYLKTNLVRGLWLAENVGVFTCRK